MKKSLLLLLTIPFLLAGCGGNNDTKNNGNKEEETHEEEKQDKKEELLQEYKFTYNFNEDSVFARFDNAYGFTDSGNEEELKNYFDDKLEYLDLIDGIELGGYVCSRKRTDDSKYYLQLGSQKVEGSLKWKSTVKIYKVEAEVINFTNGSYTVDTGSVFHIDSDAHPLTIAEGGSATKKIFSKDYAEGVNSFTISSSVARVLISKLSITWRG